MYVWGVGMGWVFGSRVVVVVVVVGGGGKRDDCAVGHGARRRVHGGVDAGRGLALLGACGCGERWCMAHVCVTG